MSKLATSKSAQDKLEENIRQRELQARGDLARVLATTEGRRFLRALIFDECQVDACTFTGNSQGMFAEGKRAVGLKLQAAIKATQFPLFLRMLEEDHVEQETARNLREAAETQAKDEFE